MSNVVWADVDVDGGAEGSDVALPPHPRLAEYYGAGRDAKASFLRQIFDATADDYDRLEHVVALGSGRWYRRQALRRAGLVRDMRVLDVATGTGLVAREALGILGDTGQVIGIDPSLGMLRGARSLVGLRPVLGTGESLPLADGQFDFVSMGYALRHLSDLRVAFAEFFRVLRPGGRVCILELLLPQDPLRRCLLDAYFRLLLPIVARLATRCPHTARLWRYYWETIGRCVPAHVVLGALGDVGFQDARRRVSFGLFSEFTATRPSPAPSPRKPGEGDDELALTVPASCRASGLPASGSPASRGSSALRHHGAPGRQ